MVLGEQTRSHGGRHCVQSGERGWPAAHTTRRSCEGAPAPSLPDTQLGLARSPSHRGRTLAGPCGIAQTTLSLTNRSAENKTNVFFLHRRQVRALLLRYWEQQTTLRFDAANAKRSTLCGTSPVTCAGPKCGPGQEPDDSARVEDFSRILAFPEPEPER